MPELIQGGPDISVELMNRRDDGVVVFFCGSGISVGTGLPDFPGLVADAYARTGQRPDELEAALCERKQFDKVLGLLEGRLNPGRLRREVITRLSDAPTGPLDAHRALLELSRVGERGLRIVTTNFDDRFERAVRGLIFDSAPKLPIPKPHGWASLVHLHGRIQPNDRGDDLVLTAADFGRAYLTERWASRFITELFREFTIVFVGYSLDDPVLSYMVDALAAERSRGARFQQPFAFAGHESGEENEKQAEIAWLGKNVTPIPFDSSDNYRKLNETLVEWARLTRDPISGRRQIVVQGLRTRPADIRDPVAQRVVWALSDKTTAEVHMPPVSDENDHLTFAAWLDILDEAGLLSRSACRLPDGSERQCAIVGNALSADANQPLDDVTARLAFWLSRNIHIPQVLGWAVRKGGYLHPQFRYMVRRELATKRTKDGSLPPIPARLRLLWTILLQAAPVDAEEDLWWGKLVSNAASPLERSLVEQGLIASLRPRLVLRTGPSADLRFRNLATERPPSLTALDECAHTDLVVGHGRHDTRLERASFREDLLAMHAFAITDHLSHAVELLPFDESGFKHPMFYRPSIANHEQNRDRNDWTFLIEWARDSYFALAKKDRELARQLLDRWILSGKGLLHRLALHALTEDDGVDAAKAKGILLGSDTPGIWNDELHHEVMVFLRKAGHRLPADILSELLRVVKSGLPPEDAEEETRHRGAWRVGLRLRKLETAGVKLNAECQALAEASRPENAEDLEREEFLSWIGKLRRAAPGERVRNDWKDMPLADLIAKARENGIDEEAFEGACHLSPYRAFVTLRTLSKDDLWPPQYWRRLLWAVYSMRRNGKLRARMDRYIVALLSKAPAALHADAGSAISQYVEDYSHACPTEQEATFSRLWHKAWAGLSGGDDAGDDDDVLNLALNSTAGRLAEAALARLWKYSPQASKGLPAPARGYFDAVAATEAGKFGRIMLAAQLSNLFAIDPDWTTRSLLTRMRCNASPEARHLWAAYAWAAHAGPNLLATFKADFLTALRNYNDLGRQRPNLIYLFVAASMDPNSVFKPDEVQCTMGLLSEDALLDVAGYFESYLGDESENHAERWRDKAQPWLRNYWPTAVDRNTAKTSIALVECLIKTGEEFPRALEWAREFLRPGTDHVLWRIQEGGVHQRFPRETLAMLVIMIPDENFSNWNRHSLREMLDQMREVDENISLSVDYQRLYRRT